jgi:hypothetical protein
MTCPLAEAPHAKEFPAIGRGARRPLDGCLTSTATEIQFTKRKRNSGARSPAAAAVRASPNSASSLCDSCPDHEHTSSCHQRTRPGEKSGPPSSSCTKDSSGNRLYNKNTASNDTKNHTKSLSNIIGRITHAYNPSSRQPHECTGDRSKCDRLYDQFGSLVYYK